MATSDISQKFSDKTNSKNCAKRDSKLAKQPCPSAAIAPWCYPRIEGVHHEAWTTPSGVNSICLKPGSRIKLDNTCRVGPEPIVKNGGISPSLRVIIPVTGPHNSIETTIGVVRGQPCGWVNFNLRPLWVVFKILICVIPFDFLVGFLRILIMVYQKSPYYWVELILYIYSKYAGLWSLLNLNVLATSLGWKFPY